MATGKMYECGTKRRFRTEDGQTEWRWVPRPVKDIAKGDAIRCAHCDGEVRLHRKRVANGPPDHVQHVSPEDARHCRGGGTIAADDVHQMSSKPVE